MLQYNVVKLDYVPKMNAKNEGRKKSDDGWEENCEEFFGKFEKILKIFDKFGGNTSI